MNRQQRRAGLSTARARKSWEWQSKNRAQLAAEGGGVALATTWRNLQTAYLNDFYSVQVYHVETDWGQVTHAIVREHEEREPPWRDLQRIKNELFGSERVAVQVYPRVTEVVDQANLYHLWLLPVGMSLPFGLHTFASGIGICSTVDELEPTP